MKKSLFHIACLLFWLCCATQISKPASTQRNETISECGGMDSVLARKGNWKKLEDDLAFPDKSFPRNQFNQVNRRADSMIFLFKEAVQDLRGIEPRWYRGIRGQSWMPDGPVPYQAISMYFGYYCNTNVNKIMLEDETGTLAQVFVNDWGWLCEKVDDWDINDDGKMIGIFSLPPKAGSWKGKTLYTPRAPNSSYAVVIGHNDKLPWHTLTQKQYLTGLKKMLQQKRKEALDYDHEKIKKASEAELKKYKDNASKFFDDELKYIDEYLTVSSATVLAQPAIIDPKFNTLKFRGTFGSEDKGGTRVIAFSSKYFDKTLPRYVPQFIVLYWRWTKDPVSQSFKKQFEENFPLEKLKAMTDK